MGHLGILLFPWVAKRKTRLEGDMPLCLFLASQRLLRLLVSQLVGESRLKSLLNVAWFLEESCPHPFGVLALSRNEFHPL